MNSLFSVKEKVILLTGGYGILGACMAKHLAREGAYVVILGRNEQKGSALVNEIKAEGGEALFLVSNVLDKALLEQNKQEILKAYGKIDVLVNLAGGNQAGATIPPDKTICRQWFSPRSWWDKGKEALLTSRPNHPYAH